MTSQEKDSQENQSAPRKEMSYYRSKHAELATARAMRFVGRCAHPFREENVWRVWPLPGDCFRVGQLRIRANPVHPPRHASPRHSGHRVRAVQLHLANLVRARLCNNQHFGRRKTHQSQPKGGELRTFVCGEMSVGARAVTPRSGAPPRDEGVGHRAVPCVWW